MFSSFYCESSNIPKWTLLRGKLQNTDSYITRRTASKLTYIYIRTRSWLRHCATSPKVRGSIPDGVTGIFHWHNPSGRTMALGSTQPLTEMRTRNTTWVKSGRCVGLTTLPPSCADCLEMWEPQPSGTLWAYPGLQWDCFTFLYI